MGIKENICGHLGAVAVVEVIRYSPMHIAVFLDANVIYFRDEEECASTYGGVDISRWQIVKCLLVVNV